MVAFKAHSVTIGGKVFSGDKAGYPELPTVYGGLSINWGAASCIDHPDVSRAQASLWIPKTHEAQIPELGDVILIKGGNVTDGIIPDAQLFAGKIESVKLKDSYEDNGVPGYFVDIVAADALAEAARLRLADVPWLKETAYARQERIAALATRSGVEFLPGRSVDQGYVDALYTVVDFRDVDSSPALEIFQRTVMASGHTVGSIDNVVQPTSALKLPNVLSSDTAGNDTQYSWTGEAGGSTSIQQLSGETKRTNWATNPTSHKASLNFIPYTGTGGAVTTSRYSTRTRNGDMRLGIYWSRSSTSGTTGFAYKEPDTTGSSGSKVSVGVWVQIGMAASQDAKSKTMSLVGTLYNGTTAVGTKSSGSFTVTQMTDSNAGWRYLKLNGITATGAYDSIQLAVHTVGNMLAGEAIFIDGVLIEKTATGGDYFDGHSLAPEANIVTEQTAGIPAFNSSALMDDSFEIDTSRVVNEINVDMKILYGSAWDPSKFPPREDANQIYRDIAGTRKTTPQTRSIATDWLILDPYLQGVPATTPMVIKGRLLLAGQSKAKWRLSSALVPILPDVPEQTSLLNLVQESTRFGALIRIDNGPTLVENYMRVHGGQLVIREDSYLELDLEPVEYSAPIPLCENTLAVDPIASNFRIGNFHTLTANDLRSIGAR